MPGFALINGKLSFRCPETRPSDRRICTYPNQARQRDAAYHGGLSWLFDLVPERRPR